jgi:hypothetical protein
MKDKKTSKKGKPEFPDIKKIEKNARTGSKKTIEVPKPPDDIPYKKSPEEVPDITPDEADRDLTAEDEDGNVTPSEKKDLADAAQKMPTNDENALRRARLDTTDNEGDLLNEGSGLSGTDLDVPGSEADDADEAIGEEDEENNPFSTNNETEDRNKDIE